MGDHSKIEWTDATWNPIRGCSAVSPGCAHCYAATVAARFNGPGMPYEGLATRDPRARWTGEVRLVPEHLADPLRWQRPRRVFVNSMSDLFHESLPFETIAAIFGVMAAAGRHTFQVLTKRPRRMLDFFMWTAGTGESEKHCRREAARLVQDPGHRSMVLGFERPWPLPNVWLGVSAEDQQRADERIPLLLKCPAAVRWISAEPLLGDIELGAYLEAPWWVCPSCGWRGNEAAFTMAAQSPPLCPPCGAELEAGQGSSRLDWVVVGGESGQGARPCDVAWIGSIVEQCAAEVPVFVKQLGASIGWRLSDGRKANDPALWGTAADSRRAGGVTDPKGGDPDEWPERLRVRQWPEVHALDRDPS